MNFIKREKSRIYENIDSISLKTKLKEYPYILDNYDIRFMDYDIFIEIVFENKVVGFLSLSIIDKTMRLNDTYILPEFRNNHLLLEQMLKILVNDFDLCIYEPTHDFIEILLHYKIADKLSDTLIATALPIDISKEHSLYTSDFEANEFTSTYLYDMNLCSPIIIHNITSKGKCDITYQTMLKEDEKYCKSFRDKTNMNEYFNKFKKYFISNARQFIKVLYEIQKNLPRKNIIKISDKIDKLIKKEIEKGNINSEDKEDIAYKIQKEYNEGNILDESLETYLNYLIKNEDNEITIEHILKNICPNCYFEINTEDKICEHCGWNLTANNYNNQNNTINELIETHLNKTINTFFENEDEIKSIEDKFNEYIKRNK